jgi:hypothetical protein
MNLRTLIAHLLYALRLCLRVGLWRGGEGKAYGEVNPCLRVLKKQGKGFGGLEVLHLFNFKVPQIGGLNIHENLPKTNYHSSRIFQRLTFIL